MTQQAAGRLGAQWTADSTTFRVWAPAARTLDVILDDTGQSVALTAQPGGYFDGTVAGVAAGARYRYRINGDLTRPDPASAWQPDGVHGPSAVLDPWFAWTDQDWRGLALEALVVYELPRRHVHGGRHV